MFNIVSGVLSLYRTETKISFKNLVVCYQGALRKKTAPETVLIPGSQSKIPIYVICSYIA